MCYILHDLSNGKSSSKGSLVSVNHSKFSFINIISRTSPATRHLKLETIASVLSYIKFIIFSGVVDKCLV